MFPISVDPAWYDNHWYSDASKARSNREIIARIAKFVIAVSVIGLLGHSALTPQGVTLGRAGFDSTAPSSSPPRVAIAANQRTSCRRAAALTLVVNLLVPAQTMSGSNGK